MENIRKGASNLNSLKLDDSHISAEDTCALIHLDSAENIKTLSICASLIDEMNEERGAQPMDILLQEWISYIGSKYTQLTDMEMWVVNYMHPVEDE